MEAHIRFDPRDHVLWLLDQRLLPAAREYCACRSWEEAVDAIRNMVVRGAPAIGVTAAFACALAAFNYAGDADWQKKLRHALDKIRMARPTAVNLAWAVDRMESLLQSARPAREDLPELWLAEALRIQAEDENICRAIGRAGACLIHSGDCVLTHCNAGALATAGYGTALGVIRAAWEEGKKLTVIADETRPFFQGSRLTAYELTESGIPVSVACDNACALLMRKGLVNLVIVGADRIAANGDTANKIGTLGVAILAAHFGIPFYVAAPLSTIDASIADGSLIPIEERPEAEVRQCGGTLLCPPAARVFNFAFDVTPAQLISGIITEKGILANPYGPAIAAALDAD